MKHFLEKYKIYLLLTSYVVEISLTFYFLAIPLLNKIQEKSNEVQAKEIDNQIIKNRISKIPDMESVWENCQNKKESLDVILDRSAEVDFIKKLEYIAEDTGNIISLKVSGQGSPRDLQRARRTADKSDSDKPIEDDLGYKEYISLEINLKGKYDDLIKFLKRAENDQYYMNIIAIDLKKEIIDNVEEKRGTDFFSAPVEVQKKEEASAKKIISSTLNVVVYVKK
jgi:hypothetical protein